MHTVILIIEDNADILENSKELLELSNYQVYTAENGKKGLEVAQKVRPDLILCDITMPELDGYGVLRALSNNPDTKNIPFIFTTGKSEKSDFRKGMDLGADDYLAKPFTGDDLLSLVSTRLKKYRIHHENGAARKIPANVVTASFLENIHARSDQVISRKIRKGDVLFSEGDSARYLHVMVSGKMKALKINEQGKEYITRIYGAQEFLGYSSLHESGVYDETAEAIEDCEIASIPADDFFELVFSDPGLCRAFIGFISNNLSELNTKLLGLAYNSARKRVAEAILYLAYKYYKDPGDGVSFSVCRENLSAISGVSPESVSRNLTDLRTEHLIELHHGHIRILNLKKLTGLKN